MNEFFAKDYPGAPFQLFGVAHLVALAIVLGINLLLPYFKRNSNELTRRSFRYGLAAVLLVNECLWHWWNWSIGQWTIQTMLPLHICSLMVFLSAIMLITRSYGLYEFLYFLGIGAATQALLTPDAGPYGFPHFRFFQVIISHGAIVTSAVYMTMVEGYRPYPRSLLRVFVGANLYMAVVGVINWLLDSNYLFIAHKPETASLLDALGPWPWYILSMEAVGLALCLILYLPFFKGDRQRLSSKVKTLSSSG
jgi:hypothetical integral membrane protein (TIGR02206 family)